MKTGKKLLVIFCCVALLCSVFSVAVFAKQGLNGWPEGTPAPPEVYGYEWASLGAADKAYVQGNYFIIETTATLESGKEYTELLYISLPEQGGFRLQSKHEYQQQVEASHAGLFEPKVKSIDLKTDSAGAKILTGSDGTSVKFTQYDGGFKLQVCSTKDKNIVSITNQQISFAYKKDEIVRVMVELPLTGDTLEVIYQGGERFRDVNQVGNYNSLTNVGAANWGAFSYINVPLFHSNRGYSIWFNMVYPGEADIGANNAYKYSIQFDGDKLDFFLWAGMPQENLKKYTDITGTSGVHEEWVYSFWAGACDTAWHRPNAMANMMELLEGYLDNYGFYPRSLGGEWSIGVDATAMQYQKERGIRSLGWFMPGNKLSSSLVDGDLAGMTATPTVFGEENPTTYSYPYPYVESLFNQGIYKVLDDRWYDGSNPAFEQVIRNRWNNIWGYGSVGAMLDYGEKYSYYGISWNGLSGMEMHNLNPYYIARSHYNVWTERLGNDYVLYMRSGTAGSQYYVGNFLGDQDGMWRGFNSMVDAMISLGASGFNNYGGDMFSNGSINYEEWTQDLKNRYVPLCVFSPYMRQHGNHLVMPWKEGESLAQNFGNYYYFRENIIPSIMSAAIDANLTSNPLVQGMMFAYPYQLTLGSIDNQYLFCSDFLVCVVQEVNQHSLDVRLPDGETWYSLYTYDKFEGGQKLTVDAPTAFMPVFVKAGSVKAIDLPYSQVMGDEMHPEEQISAAGVSNDYVDEEKPHDSLLITPPDEERTTTVYVKDGESTDYQTYDYHTEVYVNKPVSNSTFTVTNTEGSSRETVLALGVAASAVTYDGQALTRLDHIPSYYDYEYGYYVEPSGLTTIYLPEGWKELKIVKGDAGYEPYALFPETNTIKRMVDGDARTAGDLPRSNDAVEFTLDYDEPQDIGRIVVKWAAGFYSSYDIEYSVDGENWTLITSDKNAETPDRGEYWWSKQTAFAGSEHTVEDGAGSFDVINVEGVTAQYIRLIPQKEGDAETAQPAISSFEVYPTTAFTPIAEDTTPLPEYDDDEEEWVDWDDEMDEATDGSVDDESGTKKRKKLIIEEIPLWQIILLIGGGILLLTGILLLILLLLKKKKKKAEEAAAAEEADENVDPPLDFPET